MKGQTLPPTKGLQLQPIPQIGSLAQAQVPFYISPLLKGLLITLYFTSLWRALPSIPNLLALFPSKRNGLREDRSPGPYKIERYLSKRDARNKKGEID
jgi:hypothetical protein